jgi:AraC-like DNA-binding protein
VIELKGGDYKVFMGNGKVNELDITENRDGTLDSGFRSILAAEIITLSDSALPYKIFRDVVAKFNGREVSCAGGRIIGVFNASSQAIACAGNVQQEFRKLKDVQVEIRMGISSGHPVTERDSIFSNALQLADWLCTITMDGQISVSALMTEACKGMFPANDSDESIFRLLSLSDERFLNSLMAAVEPTIASERISIERLSKILGISKAQLYRKITSFTGYSPNNFIQELKLKKALQLVNLKFGNVAEIAFASGFNSPSYFTKSFQKRFGTLPAKVLRSA